MPVTLHKCGGQRTTVGVVSFLPHEGPGNQTWVEDCGCVPSPTEPICLRSMWFYSGFISSSLVTNDGKHLFVLLLAILKF